MVATRPVSAVLHVFVTMACFFPVCLGRFWEGTFVADGLSRGTLEIQTSSFGFRLGGSIDFQAKCDGSDGNDLDVKILLCPETEAKHVKSTDLASLKRICRRSGFADGQADLKKCFVYSVDVSSSPQNVTKLKVQQRIKSEQFFTASLLECSSISGPSNESVSSLTCSYQLALYNPNGEHLSSDEIPLLLTYLVASAVCGAGLFVWILNWMSFRKHSNPLHRVFMFLLLIAFGTMLVQYYNWNAISVNGVATSWLVDLKNTLYSLQIGFLFFTLMVVGEGWYVCHFKVTFYRWIGMIIMLLAISAAIMLIEWIHDYFLAFAVCCCVFVIYKTIRWTSKNIGNLVRQRDIADDWVKQLDLQFLSEVTIQDQISAKEQLYRSFRCVTLSWAILSALVICVVVFLTTLTWIRLLTLEISHFVIGLAVVSLFRLRDFTPYTKIRIKTPVYDYTAIVGPFNSETGMSAIYLGEEEGKADVDSGRSQETSV